MAHISVEQLLLDVVYITATVARSPSAKTYADDSETSDWSVSEYTTCSTQGDRLDLPILKAGTPVLSRYPETTAFLLATVKSDSTCPDTCEVIFQSDGRLAEVARRYVLDFGPDLATYLSNHASTRSAHDQVITDSQIQQPPNAPQFRTQPTKHTPIASHDIETSAATLNSPVSRHPTPTLDVASSGPYGPVGLETETGRPGWSASGPFEDGNGSEEDDQATKESRRIRSRFDRTASDIYQDELYTPDVPTLAPSSQTRKSQPTLLSPYRGIFSERLQAANDLRSSSPAQDTSRKSSPFRQGSTSVAQQFLNGEVPTLQPSGSTDSGAAEGWMQMPL